MLKINNRPIGEKSPNLVNLAKITLCMYFYIFVFRYKGLEDLDNFVFNVNILSGKKVIEF
jgi:hypothetical protein